LSARPCVPERVSATHKFNLSSFCPRSALQLEILEATDPNSETRHRAHTPGLSSSQSFQLLLQLLQQQLPAAGGGSCCLQALYAHPLLCLPHASSRTVVFVWAVWTRRPSCALAGVVQTEVRMSYRLWMQLFRIYAYLKVNLCFYHL